MKIIIALILIIPLIYFFYVLIRRRITIGIWSIKVFKSNSLISNPPNQDNFIKPTIQAKDVTDVPAEFIADPFIISHNLKFYMFFEVLDKSTGKGIIGLATSCNGEDWYYEQIVLKESYHLSYPYVFKFNNEIYMMPESSEANKVLLYKAKNFPYEWDLAHELIHGKFVDSSLFQFDKKWWMFSGKSGKLHLFFSDNPIGGWMEHPMSPLISENNHITRPGGRVIVNGNSIYRYTQDGQPSYGSAIRVFKIIKLTEKEYEEKEVDLVLSGTKKEYDWRKDGMHTIDQLKIADDKWLVAVDGHKLETRNYLLWKLDRLFSKFFVKLRF